MLNKKVKQDIDFFIGLHDADPSEELVDENVTSLIGCLERLTEIENDLPYDKEWVKVNSVKITLQKILGKTMVLQNRV